MNEKNVKDKINKLLKQILRRRYTPIVFALSLIVILILSFVYLKKKNKFVTEINLNGVNEIKDQSVNVLIASLTEEDRLTSLYLFSYEPRTKKIGIIYFPGTTLLLQISKLKETKYYFIGEMYENSGFSSLRESLENDFKIKIQYHFGFKKNDFIKIMDLLGGLTLKVQNNIKYFDEKKQQWYLLPSGTVDMTGEKIFEYLDYDEGNDDFITNRKNNFVNNLFEKINEIYEIEEQTHFFRYIYSLIYTKNIGFDDFKQFIEAVKFVSLYDVKFERAPLMKVKNDDGFGYRVITTKAIDILPTSILTKIYSGETKKNITVEIINGTKINALAAKARKFLQQDKQC